MTENPQVTSDQAAQQQKEMNFRALEARYEKQLAQERAARQEAERIAHESRNRPIQEDDDNDDEPYVNKQKLEKKLAKFGEQTKQVTQNEIQKAVHVAIAEERKQNWVKSNPDFYDVLQKAEQFAQAAPDLAEAILEMPEGFERQKLVYKNIKALGLDKPQQKTPSIQEKIDQNKRSPYYQPSGVGSSPYASVGDFSSGGQKQAYEKMQQLKNNLRLG